MQRKQIACIGLSHGTAPVELRERLRCSLADLHAVLGEGTGETALGHGSQIHELVLLSTCNRVEVYACIDYGQSDPRSLLTSLLIKANHLQPRDVAGRVYFHGGFEAVTHLCRVASGLDSLVLGETQILGQVTDAFHGAEDFGSVGHILSLLFRTAIRVGKRARTETAIGANPASMSSLAIAMARQIVGPLRDRRVLVIGLGEMGLLTLKALRVRGVTHIAVANRTRERAEAVAAEWGYRAYSLEELSPALSEADVVITATRAEDAIIDPSVLETAMADRKRRLVLLDIAVPRDVDPSVRQLPEISLFDADDLRGGLDDALAARRKQVPKVEAIIAKEIRALRAELNDLAIRPLISDLRHKAELIRQREVERTLRHLQGVDPEKLEHVRHLSRSLVNKLLHEPTGRLKELAGDGLKKEYVTTVRDLFGLTTTDKNEL
ncbi:MAG: glutamyl-tRNA reductase [Candidatus Krumholzibacteria bacterium]|nr:glutamyl-tRNA reductase [Candidatus Krumholzibacteria bacterium]